MKSTTTDTLTYRYISNYVTVSNNIKEMIYAIKILKIHTELSVAQASQGQVVKTHLTYGKIDS